LNLLFVGLFSLHVSKVFSIFPVASQCLAGLTVCPEQIPQLGISSLPSSSMMILFKMSVHEVSLHSVPVLDVF
jgi:hypothetical protein